MSRFAPLPAPPYYAVTFASQRQGDDQGYDEMAARMAVLAEKQPGFLGVESARDTTGFGITVSYWQTEAAITAWKQVSEHMLAQKLGKGGTSTTVCVYHRSSEVMRGQARADLRYRRGAIHL